MSLDDARWDAIAPETLEYMLDRARRSVDHQLALMTAADQRASQLASIIMAISLGLFAASGTLWDSGHAQLAASVLACSAVALLAAVLAAYSARAVETASSGPFSSAEPPTAPVALLRAREIAALRAAHDENVATAARKARLFGLALRALIVSPFALAAAWGLQAAWLPAG